MTWLTKKKQQGSLQDENAFVDFAESIGARAFCTAYRWIRNRQGAEDLVQDALLKAWRSRAKVGDNPKAWFYKILWNAFLDQTKQNSLVSLIDDEEDIPAPWSYSNIETRMDIERLLNNLSDTDRNLVALRYAEDFTIEEISKITGMRMGTVKSRIHRALKYLREKSYDGSHEKTL